MNVCCVTLLAWMFLLHGAVSQMDEEVGGDERTTTTAETPTHAGGTCLSIKCPVSQPMSCKDVKGPLARKSAVLYDGTEVLCDTQTERGGWTVIQRRINGSVDFYRNWASYKYGFGNFSGEFWLGLEQIHHMTTKRCYELRIDMKFNRREYHAKYSYIKVWGEKENYRIDFGSYSGNAGDSLSAHRNKPFTTKDNDNDDADDNCAVQYNGGWWYADCLRSNLNGLWDSNQYSKGVTWYTITGFYKSLSFSEMKIRPCN